MAEPENHDLSFLISARRNQPQNLIDLLQLQPLANPAKAVGAHRSRVDLEGFHNRFRLIRASLHGQRRLVVVVDDVGGHHFQKPVNGVFVPRVERSQQSAVIFAELQVGVLHQIVDLRARRFAPAPRRPQHRRRDHHLKAPYELGPRSLIVRASARPDQFRRRQFRIAAHATLPSFGGILHQFCDEHCEKTFQVVSAFPFLATEPQSHGENLYMQELEGERFVPRLVSLCLRDSVVEGELGHHQVSSGKWTEDL
jgi:hypothetical protein